MLSDEFREEVQGMVDFEEIKEAWALLKERHRTIGIVMLGQFNVGIKVGWMSQKGSGGYKEGRVERINTKSITVKLENGDKWTVHPSLVDII